MGTQLEGKVAVVTGGGAGIGASICAELADEGARIVVADIDENAAARVARRLERKGIGTMAAKLDVRSGDSISLAIRKIGAQMGSPDILVNNAGVLTMSPFLELSEKDWDFVMDVNAKGVFLCTKLFAAEMARRKKRGIIVNIASIAAKVPLAHQAHYCASKAAVVALTKVSAVELAPYGIRVNVVCPGAIDTEMFANVLDYEAKLAKTKPGDIKKAILSNIGLGRLIKPSEIAGVVAFLCSDRASVISGQAINVDGGNATVNY